MVSSHYLDNESIRGQTALVMPQWFPDSVTADKAETVIRANLAGVGDYVEASRVCLVIDACPAAKSAVEAINERRRAAGVEPYVVVVNLDNLGQGGSLARGFDALLQRRCSAEWIVTRDADGDHFINDLPHLARMAHQIRPVAGDRCYMVIGRRTNLRRPMTWARGELEELVNRTVMAALDYRLARRGEVIDHRFMHPDAACADTQSGYKLYSAGLAKQVASEYRRLMDPPWGPDTYRYLGQVFPFWLCVDAGGIVGEVTRASLTDQSVSSFGPDTFRRQYRAKLHYVLKGSELPGPVAMRILANGISRSPLWTHPDGQSLCRWFVEDLSGEFGGTPDDLLVDRLFS
ncbi:MAG: hypothetical protein JXQ73_24085 [Phycisphaerae bacterium]|nr:hypothetical protein [Phycisphaerae bacterium]